MDKQEAFAAIGEAIAAAERIAVLSHVRPDGDAIGSAVALGECLAAAGKSVVVINDDGVPDNLSFLPGSERVQLPPAEPLDIDLAIVVDTASRARAGERSLAAAATARTWISIDHHISNDGYADINWIDARSPATGQIIYELARTLDLPLTPAARDCLFVAISTDTGSFQYPNTTAETFRIGAALIEAGADVGDLSQKTYESYPLRRVALMRALLDTLRVEAGGKLASWSLPLATVREIGARPEDTEGMIDFIRAIEGVIVAIFFEELPDGVVRMSTRSKSKAVDVCQLCQQFGGGGHSLAAGARIRGELDDVRTAVLEAAARAIAEPAAEKS